MKLTTVRCPKCKIGHLCWSRKWLVGPIELRCEYKYGCGFRDKPDHMLDNALSKANALERKLMSMYEPIHTSKDAAAANKALKAIIFKFHPDRNQKLVSAADVVAELNKLRDLL